MAQIGYTPIQLYYSTTVSQAPSAGNLASGELAINITDGRLYYKDNGGSVQVIGAKLGTNVATALGTNVGTAGAFVVNGGALGTPSSGTVTNLTGTASININGTVGSSTQTTGYFTVVRMYGSSSGYVGFQGAAAAGSTTYTLPSADGTANQVLQTNGSGTLSWATPSSGITTGKSIAMAMIFGF